MERDAPKKNFTPRVLVISPYPIMPADTGAKIRIYELAQGASRRGFKVTVVMPASPGQFSQKKINENLALDVIPYPFIIPFLCTNKPFSYMYLISFHPLYRLFLQKYIENHDIIQFEQASFADMVHYIPKNKLIIYDAHNVEADYVLSDTQWPWIGKISSQRIYRLENKIIQRADHVITCSGIDVMRIHELYKPSEKPFSIVHNGIHINREELHIQEEEIKKTFPGIFNFPSRAIFSGSDVEHNRLAVRFILESLAPELSEECAFIIKGQCGNRYRNHNLRNVFIDTAPGNVGPYSKICTVALNPVYQGSGTSLKVLDYLVNRLPVISTEFGMRGYEDLRSLVILSSLQEFPKKILNKPKILDGIEDAIKKYSWDSAIETLENIYLQYNTSLIL